MIQTSNPLEPRRRKRSTGCPPGMMPNGSRTMAPVMTCAPNRLSSCDLTEALYSVEDDVRHRRGSGFGILVLYRIDNPLVGVDRNVTLPLRNWRAEQK